MAMHESALPARVGALLRQLPEFEPGGEVWSRIHQAHQRRQRRRVVGAGAGVTLTATLAVFLLLPQRVVLPDNGELEAWQARSQALEQQWQAAAARGDARQRARLHRIDDELQVAYDRGAGAEVLAPLWKQRSAALLDLIHHEPGAAAPIRL